MLALAAITVLAAMLRLYRLGDWSFWVDEAHTYRDLLAARDVFWSSDVSSYPLSFVLLRWLVDLGMPTAEGWLRLPFAFFGIISVPALGLVGRGLVGPRASLLAALLLAFSPWHIYWSQSARSYAMVLFFALLAVAVFFRGMRRRSPLLLLLSLSLTAVAGLCHPSAYILLAGYVGYGLTLLRWPGRGDRATGGGLHKWMPLISIALLATLVIVLMPLLEHVRKDKPDFSLFHLLQTLAFFVRIPVIVAALGGLLWLFDRGSPSASLLLAWIAVPVLALAVLALLMKMTAQYAFYTLPGFCLLAATVVLALANRVTAAGFRGHLLRAVPLGILLLDMAGQSYLYFERNYGERPRWREVRTYLQHRPGAVKRVLTTNQPSLSYYLNPMDFTGRSFAGSFEVVGLAKYKLQGSPTAFFEEHIASSRKSGVELYVAISEPELDEMEPRGVADAFLREHFLQVRRLPNWNGPKDMTVLIYWLPTE